MQIFKVLFSDHFTKLVFNMIVSLSYFGLIDKLCIRVGGGAGRGERMRGSEV